jgi:plastocyanin
MRLPRLLAAALLCLVTVSACATASAGWTYAPAPSLTPPPAASGSPGASGEASPGATAEASANPNLVMISALNVAYEQSQVTAPAGKPFQISFTNKDAGTPHNVSIHQGGATGNEVFKGDIFPGVATKIYDVPALAAGQYSFVCTVHPTMVGTLNVQ